MMIQMKTHEIAESKKHKREVKNECEIYQYQQKNLYINLLLEPSLAIERGLFLEDIMVFLMCIDVKIREDDLYDKFFDEEKEFLIMSSTLQYEFLQKKNQLEQWATNFSLREKDQRKRIIANKNKEGEKSKLSTQYGGGITQFINEMVQDLQKVAETKINGLLKTIKRDQMKVEKPVKFYDHKSQKYVTKWVEDRQLLEDHYTPDKMYESNIQWMNKYMPHDMVTENPFTKEDEKKEVNLKELLEQILLNRKLIIKGLFRKLSHKLKDYNGRTQTRMLNDIKVRFQYLFGKHEADSLFQEFISEENFNSKYNNSEKTKSLTKFATLSTWKHSKVNAWSDAEDVCNDHTHHEGEHKEQNPDTRKSRGSKLLASLFM